MSFSGWDRFDGYLFDIDGTLLECRDAVHYFAFVRALREISGRELTLEGVTVHGSIDPNILADALQLSGMPEKTWRPMIPAVLQQMAADVQKNRSQMQVQALRGTREVLEHLKSRNALLGLATGNLEAIAWTKLEACGLREFFTFGGFSDRCRSREECVRSACEKAILLAGQNAKLCIVGDTPADIAAARHNGLPVIAVASGIYSYRELLAAGPDICLSSLEELLPDRATSAKEFSERA